MNNVMDVKAVLYTVKINLANKNTRDISLPFFIYSIQTGLI